MSLSIKRPASKTKLIAIRNKPAVRPKVTVNNDKTVAPQDRLLTRMMERYHENEGDVNVAATSFCDIMKDFGMNDRNTGHRLAWNGLIADSVIVAVAGGKGTTFTSDFMLTEQGLEAAKSLGFNVSTLTTTASSAKAMTNEELHDRIKSKCINNRGCEIFKLLLGKGPLSRKELAEQELGISNTGAYFSYALAQLKELGYVEPDPSLGKGKLRLSDKCFLSPSDRDLLC